MHSQSRSSHLPVYWLAILASLVHLVLNYIAFLPENWSSALHFGLFGSLIALMNFRHRAVQLVLVALIAICTLYLPAFEDLLYDRGQDFILSDYVISATAIIIALILTYRVIGWFIPVLILVALTYLTFWGQYVPGIFHFKGLSLESVLFRSYFSPDGMFGTIAQLSWTFVFMFVLFGAFLQISGAGDYLLYISSRIASKVRGGPGLVAVIASGAMGSVSGSAIANTAATGVITIPSMRRAGFSREFSAGVEAAASTGGQLMPPIMGAGAFIMASYTQLPYVTIITAAFLPAILYYLAVGFFVRAYAIKHHIESDTTAVEPSDRPKYKNGWRHLAAIATLVGLLIAGFTPLYAVMGAIIVIIALSWVSEKPMTLTLIADSLAEGSKGMAVTAVLLVTIGLLVNAITTSGIGNTFSLMAVTWSGGSLIVLLLLIAVASLILGAGLPVTASYIIVATLLAPVLSDLIASNLLTEMVAGGFTVPKIDVISMLLPDFASGASSLQDNLIAAGPETRQLILEMALTPEMMATTLLASHLIIFWLSQDSNVTPPVCLVAYTAAGIAEASHSKTAFSAWKLAKGLYIVPVLMAYSQLVMGDTFERVVAFFFSALGLFCVVCAWEGVVTNKVNRPSRALLAACGLLLLWPGIGIAMKLGVVAMLAVAATLVKIGGYRKITRHAID